MPRCPGPSVGDPALLPTVRTAWKISLMPLGSRILSPHLPGATVTMVEGRTMLHTLYTFQLCLPKILWRWEVTGKPPHPSKGPLNQNLESKKGNLNSEDLHRHRCWVKFEKHGITFFEPDSHSISIISIESMVLKFHGNLYDREILQSNFEHEFNFQWLFVGSVRTRDMTLLINKGKQMSTGQHLGVCLTNKDLKQ